MMLGVILSVLFVVSSAVLLVAFFRMCSIHEQIVENLSARLKHLKERK